MYHSIHQHIADRRVLKVVEAINANPNWNLAKFAQMVNLSKSRLMHLFKENTNTSISEYLRVKRLNYAAELLRLTELRVKEISYEVGYDHPQSFVRAFKNQYHLTPSIFRDQQFARPIADPGLKSTTNTPQPEMLTLS